MPGVLNDAKGQTVMQGASFSEIFWTSVWAPVVVSSLANLVQMSSMSQRNEAKQSSADARVSRRKVKVAHFMLTVHALSHTTISRAAGGDLISIFSSVNYATLNLKHSGRLKLVTCSF